MTEKDLTTWMTPSQAAQRLNVSAELVRQYCRSGKLEFIMTSAGRLINPESVEKIAEERAKNPPKAFGRNKKL